MVRISEEKLSEQMKLCDQAVQAMRRYREARGVLPEEKVAGLREKAEALFAQCRYTWRRQTIATKTRACFRPITQYSKVGVSTTRAIGGFHFECLDIRYSNTNQWQHKSELAVKRALILALRLCVLPCYKTGRLKALCALVREHFR